MSENKVKDKQIEEVFIDIDNSLLKKVLPDMVAMSTITIQLDANIEQVKRLSAEKRAKEQQQKELEKNQQNTESVVYEQIITHFDDHKEKK